jgi:hypothetical protein
MGRGGVAVWKAVCGVLACAHRPPPAEGPTVVLVSGALQSVVHLDLPRVSTPTGQLVLNDGTLFGSLDQGALNVDIHEATARGWAGAGAVALAVSRDGSLMRLSGTWNGVPVKVEIDDARIFASLVQRGSRFAPGEKSCVVDLRRGSDGPALVGSATCLTGLPAETRLLIDPRVRALLRPAELAVLLTALLADTAFE